ncbi:hypothetical protein STANM309S_01499 [Streptomyces tanashiensis]
MASADPASSCTAAIAAWIWYGPTRPCGRVRLISSTPSAISPPFQLPVLLRQGYEFPARARAGRAAGVREQHQREQARRLGVVGGEPVQHPGEPDRLRGQLGRGQHVAGAGRVALVEDEVGTCRTSARRAVRSSPSGCARDSPPALITCLARLIRCAMVGSGTRKAAAICAVVRPPTARRVSAILLGGGDRSGWQQRKSRDRESSRSVPDSSSAACARSSESGVARATASSRRRRAASLRTWSTYLRLGGGADRREVVLLEQRSPGGGFLAWRGLGNPERGDDRGRGSVPRWRWPLPTAGSTSSYGTRTRASTRVRAADGSWSPWRRLSGDAEVQDGLAVSVDAAGRVHVYAAGRESVRHWVDGVPRSAPLPLSGSTVASAGGELLYRAPAVARLTGPDGDAGLDGYGGVVAARSPSLGTVLLGTDEKGRVALRAGDRLRTLRRPAVATALHLGARGATVVGLGADGHPWSWHP